jgi:hypothetical protein
MWPAQCPHYGDCLRIIRRTYGAGHGSTRQDRVAAAPVLGSYRQGKYSAPIILATLADHPPWLQSHYHPPQNLSFLRRFKLAIVGEDVIELIQTELASARTARFFFCAFAFCSLIYPERYPVLPTCSVPFLTRYSTQCVCIVQRIALTFASGRMNARD